MFHCLTIILEHHLPAQRMCNFYVYVWGCKRWDFQSWWCKWLNGHYGQKLKILQHIYTIDILKLNSGSELSTHKVCFLSFGIWIYAISNSILKLNFGEKILASQKVCVFSFGLDIRYRHLKANFCQKKCVFSVFGAGFTLLACWALCIHISPQLPPQVTKFTLNNMISTIH